ncbi:MAG TPA: HAD-IC family P-type ATPase, partial [Bacteroidota bacterium]
ATVAFDKTGTLTAGKFAVTDIKTGMDHATFLSLVASLEKNSEHPLGKAIVEYAQQKGTIFAETRNVSAIPGQGIKGEVRVNGHWKEIVAGSENMFLNRTHSQQTGSGSAIFAGWDGAVQGSVLLVDSLRHHARETVEQLQQDGIATALLSGDSDETTHAVARDVAIQQYYGKLMPGDKLIVLESLKAQGTVIMVGDGINDAPSLAAADAGVTLGSATDIAKESADVTILGDHLEKLPWLIRFSRKTLSTIRWNLFWAFAYNAVGIALAVVGLLHPIVAALAMVGSSAFIIVNSRRLGKE